LTEIRHQQRHVTNLAGPTALEHDTVEIEIGLLALDRLAPPGQAPERLRALLEFSELF
jgi:hypothetical protein